MDMIYLPYLQGDDDLAEAMRRMKVTDSRAIIVNLGFEAGVGHKLRMHMNRVVVQAWRDNVDTCAGLSAYTGADITQDVIDINPYEALDPGSLLGTSSLFDLLEGALDANNVGYGVFSPRELKPEALTLVLTRHERFRDAILMATKVCACDLSKHAADSPPVADGQPCRDCGGTYSCY